MIRSLIQWCKEKLNFIIDIKDTRHAIALGVALGFFWGFTPFIGLKTILAFFTAWLFRANKVAALVAVTLHEVLWVIGINEIFLAASYAIAEKMSHASQPRIHEKIKIHKLFERYIQHPLDLFPWFQSHAKEFLAFTIASILLAIPICIGIYYLTLWGIDYNERRKAARTKEMGGDAGK